MQLTTVLFQFYMVSLIHLSRSTNRCDPRCKEWPSDGNPAKVPFEVGPCCPERKETATGSCPLDQSTWDQKSWKCASFCPARVSYDFGRPIPILTKHKCSTKSMPCYLYENQTAIFKGPKFDQQLPNSIDVYNSFSNDEETYFNWNGLIAAHEGTLHETASDLDGSEGYRAMGGFWAFLPVQRTTCGTYTESIDEVDSAISCVDDMPKTTATNICISRAVSYSRTSNKAVGLTQLIPTYLHTTSGVEYVMPDDRNTNPQYKQAVQGSPWLGYGEPFVREYSKYESRDHPAEVGKAHQKSECATIGTASPIFEHCLRAATDFYTPLYDSEVNLKQDSWAQGCSSTDSQDHKNCLTIATYATCEIRLGFTDGYKDMDAVERVKSDDCKPHVFALLGLFARLLEDCGSEGHVEGGIILNDGTHHKKCRNKLYFARADS